ncbi:SMC-Scp complex subunit ScpB [Peribacillus frigoritolerans]|uniref:Segregation and condensation protein B n=3 Tax=Peribacillus TaxID=2675229 RepID=A0AAJ1QPK5_9BACI|nr:MULTISPECIES: SMC-Scp complex subunit ScpB [Bacillaceae]KOR86768.1 segregation and condensation protein B [Bacillus sp. FJAT-22058]KRF49599.1 segregation and condensation protein B [Bacillus sp. Soil745]MBD8138880.1 SMC-Scp complex subunit ScpB [Bacillus sp. CFBP 13597]MBT2603127.1 SMC-Scp complex subunit ScpB [Bacillus sp. ISL-53]MCD1159876.1 SMC-Scp complex subunit ScpB [Peribacillus castrilensis]MDP9740263.1 segregation and condensation protein B [Bacillus sp. B2I3]PEF35221.1 segregati
MEVINWKGILEALLFAAGDEGLSVKQIASVLEITEYQATDIVESLKEEYVSDVRGIQVIEIAGVYQMTTKKEHSDYLKRLVETSSTQGLSQAALETLAIIAYKQPITRAEIDEIRGVKTERPIHTLVTKVLIKEVGRAEGSGRAYLYGTTKEFLDYFGLNSIDELPPLADNSDDSFESGEADLFFEKFQQTIE